MSNVLELLSLWHIMGKCQLVWAEMIFTLFLVFFMWNQCVCVSPCAQTQLHAMSGYWGWALIIRRPSFCPIRSMDSQTKHSIDYLHFIIKPIITWKGEKRRIKDEIKLQSFFGGTGVTEGDQRDLTITTALPKTSRLSWTKDWIFGSKTKNI